MSDHYITWTELLMVALIGSAPALIAACILQVRYATRRGWRGGTLWLRPAIMCVLTVAVALPTTIALWTVLPVWLLETETYLLLARWLPVYVAILLIPSMLGAAIGTMVSRGVGRGLRWKDGA